jgi:hypothetical protein
MTAKILLMFVAIAAVLGLGTVGIVAIQPASAQDQSFTIGDDSANNVQTSDQSACEAECETDQNRQVGIGNENFQ